MSGQQLVAIAGRRVGGGQPPLVLPDIDVFFNQDLGVARAMIEALIAAGVECVKGAVLHRAQMALDDRTHASYFDGAGMIEERYRDLIARKVVSLEDTERLFAAVHAAGLPFVLSVYDIDGADFARAIGAAAIKIPSSNLTHQVLVVHAASLGLPLVIDTGKSTLEEIARAENWARDAGARDIVLEHSPLPPPAALSEHHLRMIPALAALFGRPVGLSDHHHGNEMMLAAAALGAAVLEKGVCPDDAPPDQDTHHAMRISEVAGVVRACAMVHEALGAPMRALRRERDPPVDRMGLVARVDLTQGEAVSLATVDFAFPARGIGAEHWSLVEGWRIRRPRAVGAAIGWDDVEPVAPQAAGTRRP